VWGIRQPNASEDFGKTWHSLKSNLSWGSPRCLREDIGNPDLLFLGRCVGGRLNQTASEALDVRGLYTRLAACRAVIAARWPICNIQAATFTVEFMMGYLSALKEAKTRGEPAVADFVRARILNDVRRRLTRPTADRPPLVTRHLAHAFELYGLG